AFNRSNPNVILSGNERNQEFGVIREGDPLRGIANLTLMGFSVETRHVGDRRSIGFEWNGANSTFYPNVMLLT
ncbi:MAG: hypothetical protein RLP02_35820, partial [Coleofasciculus sp. C2-GNP5-27]